MRYYSILALGTLCAVSNVHALDLGYSHTYEDYRKRHFDQINLSHTFKNNVTVAFETRAQSLTSFGNDQSSTAFARDRITEYHYKLKYRHKFTSQFDVVPELEWDHYHQSERYKARIALNYKINPEFRVYSKYRYDYYYNENRSDFDLYAIELGVNQTKDKFGFTYGYDQYYSNRGNLYNNQKTDYKYKFAVEYRATPTFAPYTEIRNESVNNKTSQRQTTFEVGFNYKFF